MVKQKPSSYVSALLPHGLKDIGTYTAKFIAHWRRMG